MPAVLPYTSRRRRAAIPTAYHKLIDAHDKTLERLGLQKLNSSNSTALNSDSHARDSGKKSMSTTTEATATSQRKIGLVDLPDEIQKQIFSFAKHADLIALSLVSQRMRDVAASILYRTFHIVFPDDDDPANDYPIDSLASGLDTFATSEYDYARYLRHIVLEALSCGIKGELAYRHYQLDASCGKFMNTLLLITLRKAKSLEDFTWDIRVELSREVFKALHNLKSLQHLHLRMQAGDSIHLAAPPLPNSDVQSSLPPSPYLPAPPPLTHHNNMVFVSPLPTTFSDPVSLPTSKSSLKKQYHKSKPPSPIEKGPPTISKFSKLKTLSILDMDSHEYLEEIKTCIENSSSTLETLQLSFSEFLANKSKKPVLEVPSDSESDIEDEFGQIIPPPGQAVDPNAPSKALKAQEEKKSQDAALGKIFGYESKRQDEEEDLSISKEQKAKEDRTSKSIGSFVRFFTKFMSQVKPGRDDTAEAKEAKELIEKATRMYLDIQGDKLFSEIGGGISTPSSAASKADLGDKEVPAKQDSKDEEKEEPGLFDDVAVRPQADVVDSEVSKPENIDIEAPEVDLDVEFGSDAESVTPQSSALHGELTTTSTPSSESSRIQVGITKKEKQILNELDDILAKTAKNEGLGSHDWFEQAKATIDERKKSEYIRTTRGLALKTLSLHNIPVRSSILSKTIDFAVLQNLTLLGVGPQHALWNLLGTKNKESSLKLHRVHTDHVTMECMNLLSQLNLLEELYLRERKPRRGVEKETTDRTVTIDYIRKAVFRKHASTLKVLVLRNDKGKAWDLDVKAVMLLCRNATKLEELAASLSNEAMHTFLQFFQGLTALRALHILAFRHPDNCDFSRHQLPRLMIDNVANYPELKLEYIAFAPDSVERLIRRKIVTTKNDAKNVKDKEREKAVKKAKKTLQADMYSTLDMATQPLYDWQDSSSEDEEDKQYGGSGLKVDTYLYRMSDVVGVKIFEKEILSSTI